ncbi:MAG TPA: hypothetical protein VGI39_34460, partial [Polyangiaceae bacterium]
MAFAVGVVPCDVLAQPVPLLPAGAAPPLSLTIAADRDDDDADGVPDGEQAVLPPAARVDLVALDPSFVGTTFHPITGAERVRLIANGKPLPWSAAVPPGALLQGIAPGAVSIVAARGSSQRPLRVDVVGVVFRDGGRNDVDLARSHASLERTPPTRIEGGTDARYDDPDALRVVLALPSDVAVREPPGDVLVASASATGETIDVLRVALSPVACGGAGGEGVTCASSVPLRFVIDEVDQKHPLVKDRSLRAEVGGAIAVVRGGKKFQAIRVLGPRMGSAGPIGRLRATIRPTVLRVAPGGAPAIGGTDLGAVALLRGELALASAIWGQCGVTFSLAPSGATATDRSGPPVSLARGEVRIADPPPPHLLSLGDDLGLPASGGVLRFRVDGREVSVPLERSTTPLGAADQVARTVEHAGFVVVVSPNARIAPGANSSADVS